MNFIGIPVLTYELVRQINLSSRRYDDVWRRQRSGKCWIAAETIARVIHWEGPDPCLAAIQRLHDIRRIGIPIAVGKEVMRDVDINIGHVQVRRIRGINSHARRLERKVIFSLHAGNHGKAPAHASIGRYRDRNCRTAGSVEPTAGNCRGVNGSIVKEIGVCASQCWVARASMATPQDSGTLSGIYRRCWKRSTIGETRAAVLGKRKSVKAMWVAGLRIAEANNYIATAARGGNTAGNTAFDRVRRLDLWTELGRRVSWKEQSSRNTHSYGDESGFDAHFFSPYMA